ncbi:MAG: dTDP-4-dehydrorhamnose reductase [Sedimentisphaerales bacterium]|nr:dTDP-4-dehydrorhamnose reductase [Sedimentisphaerales bacterium]
MSGLPDKVVILGGKGMLGTDVAAECKGRGIDFEVFDLPEFDITNEHQLAAAVRGAKTIINCAAYTNVEKAETETELAFRVNTEAVGQLSVFARKSDAWVLHISTDFVFDGAGSKPYVEKDIPHPINAYGRTKLAGERLLVENRCRCCIMRVEWTYGLHGENFVKKFLQKARTQKEMKVIDDQFGSPTATTEAAKAVCDLMLKKPKGIYHFANQGYVSRLGVAEFIAQTLRLDVQLTACKTSDYPSAAARPLNSRFDCGKIRPLLHGPIKPWQTSLEEFLKQYCPERSQGV